MVTQRDIGRMAQQVLGECWHCPLRDKCQNVGEWLICDFSKTSKRQGRLNLGSVNFIQGNRDKDEVA